MQNLLSMVNDTPHSQVDELIAITQGTKPEMIKAIKSVAPFFSRYKIPLYGRIESNKKYDDILRRLQSQHITVTNETPENYKNTLAEIMILGSHDTEDKNRTPYSRGDTKANIYVSSKDDRKSLLHELLHEVSEHSRLEAEDYGFLERFFIPTDTRNFNYRAENILDAAYERGIVK